VGVEEAVREAAQEAAQEATRDILKIMSAIKIRELIIFLIRYSII
jgi:hypothetical protein